MSTNQTVPFGALVAGFKGNVAALTPPALAQLQGLNKAFQTQVLLAKGVHIEGNGPGVPLGTSGDMFSAMEILYHRLQVDDTTYACSYASGSGIYRNAADTTKAIDATGRDDFLQALQDGDPSNSTLVSFYKPLHNAAAGAPSILVWHQCCVIIDLVSPDLKFRVNLASNLAAIDTVADCRALYYNLTHIDTNGAPYGTTSSTACQRIYFSTVAPSATAGTNRDDQFNIYLEIDHPASVDFVVIDPFIKNRGGKPPAQ